MLSLLSILFWLVSCNPVPIPEPEQDPVIQFSVAALTADPEGGAYTVRVTASMTWSIATDGQDWLTLASATQVYAGESLVKVNVEPNFSGKPRVAELRFASGDHVRALSVTQNEIPAGAYVPEGYQLVWYDDFSEPSADLTKKWRYENWAPGRVNHELQRYVPDDRRTSFTHDGALSIVACKDGDQVISARMNSRESWLYGYFEAAIWLPKGKGTWPAFWMMPDDQSKGWPACGEIDIMEEVGVDADITSSSIHCTSYNHVKNTQKTASRKTEGAESEYHVYAMEWTADYIKTYVDGVLLLEFHNDKAGNDNTWPFNKKFYLTLNLAWGGDWGGYAGVDESALPCTMKVDYVRVYKK